MNMHCENCGKKVNSNSKYCSHCGLKVHNVEIDTNQVLLKTKLVNIYRYTGNISIIMGIVGFISGMVVGYNPKNVITDAIVALIINLPRVYFGHKLKINGINNLNYAQRLSLGMTIYSLIFLVVNVYLGTGYIYSILVIVYYISYKHTVKAIKSNES